jgi:outer membrane protein assembly complex protein YaeT
LGLVPAPAVAAPDPVVEVRVEGNKYLSTAAILANVRTAVGREYDDAVVKADVRRLLDTRRFVSVEATKAQAEKGWVVTFKVVERQVVVSVAFRGNKAFSGEELSKLLSFAAGDPLDVAAVKKGRDAIAAKYREAGYYETLVTYDDIILEIRQKVIYRIREGTRARVSRITFTGNRFFSSFWLRQRIETSQRLWPIIPGRLDMEQLDEDVETIREAYIAEGFLAVEVDRVPEFSDDKTRVKVAFLIREGPRFRVGRLIFKGNTILSDEEIARRLTLGPGAFFTPLKLQRDVKRVVDAYGELGYIETRVSARRIFAEAEGVLDIEFTIIESEQFFVGRIDIRGNTITQERVVRRNLTFYPGERFDTAAMQRSRQQLIDTRLFESVEMVPVGQAPKVRDVLVQLAEGRTANFLAGVGVSTDHGLLGNISIVERNFDICNWPTSWSELVSGRAWRGAGQTLRLVAEPGVDIMRFNIEWREPYLFDRPYSLGVQAFLFERGRESYDETRLGAAVSVGHRFKNRWYGEVTIRIENVTVDSLHADAPPAVVADRGDHLLAGLQGALVRDETDSRWLPTTGDRLRFSYEQVVGDDQFGRFNASYSRYWTVHTDALDRKHVLKARLAGGYICGDAPVFERFYGGGISWVRGFEYRGISPRSPGTSEQIGGAFTAFFGVEYEFPLLAEQVRGVAFFDSGTVERKFEITTYRTAVGVGLRWFIPFMGPVPITLDFAVPVTKDNQDDTRVFSFTIGWSF